GNDLHPRQAVNAGQNIQCAASHQCDARLTKPWAARARRPMRTGLQQGFTDTSKPPSTAPLSPFLGGRSILSCAMRNLIQLSTSITSPVFTEDRVSMVFAPYS